ncbi:MAG TPA: type II CRISPR RNA-guided endonuclease Cas9 [Sedimentisphaerales bacterium]|jgi:CRISPR-associated endonuclease Csn1|nr:type II CRISPR RNA-guided endonuclease Cas9 [Sedimentisphaerales bacterium]HNU30530.1 type II CRISPR RNA-guided endonuclease Cas9 [Sedimentisphaerales bacterium]
MTDYTLGLDIGSKSIGWTLVEHGDCDRIAAMGVRVFPEGVDRDTQGMEKSKNATRREARSARRTRQRRIDRKRRLVRTLRSIGLLPQGRDELVSLFQSDPYELRKRGLDERLDPYAFGRALYHLAQRRGFKSNRKSGKAREDGPVIKGAAALQKEMTAQGCRTLGEYFDVLSVQEQRVREHYTFRSMYLEEFDLLWAAQARYYPQILTEDLRRRVRDEIMFFQRPLKPTDNLIGDCELEPGQKRCPRGDWYALRFRILQDVNNLIVQNANGTERRLTPDERRALLDELHRKAEVAFSDIRKMFGLLETQRFNLEQDGKKTKLKGNPFTSGMRSKKAFGPKRWDEMPESEKVMLSEWLADLEDDELAARLKAQCGLDDAQAEAVLKVSLPQGYMSFSRAAIAKLIPVMEEGKLTSEAKEQVYGDRPPADAIHATDKLGLPPDIRNPIVQKALYEVRKVVNGIIREYGKPRRIKIEMARDVQGSRQQREELHWRQLDNEKRNSEVRKRITEDIGILDPTRDDVIKYKLWEECNWICPYTGTPIDKTDLFGPCPTFQVEHILPYDRSLDDSYMNLTLCEAHENIHVKKSQTPYETYSHDPQRFEQILERVNKSKMPYAKRRRFWQQEVDLDTQIQRELNDTRYICAEVVRYLRQLGISVQGTRGKITAELRHQWGLDGIFSELGVRRDDDHRRHAVDALIVAVTNNEHLRTLAASKYGQTGARFQTPWPIFRNEARDFVNGINVSHRVCRKVSGPLHEETNYGPTGLKDESGQDIYVYRKRLEDLTAPMVAKIVDPVVRDIVTQRLAENGIHPGAADRKIPKEVWKDPLYMRQTASTKRIQIKKVRIRDVKNNVILLKDRSGQPYRAVESGSNHHIEIFEYTQGPDKGKRDARVVSTYEAVRRSREDQPVVCREHGANTRFICSLAINDMVLLTGKTGELALYRVQKMSAAKQIYFRHHAAARIDREDTLVRRQATLFSGSKVTVDPLGRISVAND